MTRMVDHASFNSGVPGASPGRRLRIALAHDWLCGVRGGEHVLERIARLVVREHECAGLFVMFDDGGSIGPSVDSLRKVVATLGSRPWSDRLRRWLLPLYPAAVGELSELLAGEHAREPIDLVISTSSAAIKGLEAPRGVPHLCYCHSPARYIWGQDTKYRGGMRGLGLAAVKCWYRDWDRRTAEHVTHFIANSLHTQREIERCYGRGSDGVNPPVRSMFFEGEVGGRFDGPWLVVSALEPYKRVELAIDAAMTARHELVVVGNGSQRSALERRASHLVKFTGRVSDEELRALYHSASVLLFPQVEDFGIVAVEAQACGLPVVARAAGGALESVVDGATGALFEGDTVDSLLAAVARCPMGSGERSRANAERFSEDRFDEQIRNQIASLVSSAAAPST
jgi:glycosyltransferase involved in cell wall biosynthesis